MARYNRILTLQKKHVHTRVVTWVWPSKGPNRAKPKSESLTFQSSSIRMLDGLKSRKIICKHKQKPIQLKLHIQNNEYKCTTT
ncbi:hypothetical protein HanPSC8_Chr11g0496481 [Helianthus annuus]|nr:hypothetical protein HanPSC8_Chr11g0496481 [Helianthus annuus]